MESLAINIEDQECCLCFNMEILISVSPCSHEMCEPCLIEWRRECINGNPPRQATCPLCRWVKSLTWFLETLFFKCLTFSLCRSVLLFTRTGVPVRSVPTVPTVSVVQANLPVRSGSSVQSVPVPQTIPSAQSGATVQTMPRVRSGRWWTEIEFYTNLIDNVCLIVFLTIVCLVIGGILYGIITFLTGIFSSSGTEEIQIEEPISSLDANRIAWFCQEVRNSQPLTPFDSEYLFRNFNC